MESLILLRARAARADEPPRLLQRGCWGSRENEANALCPAAHPPRGSPPTPQAAVLTLRTPERDCVRQNEVRRGSHTGHARGSQERPHPSTAHGGERHPLLHLGLPGRRGCPQPSGNPHDPLFPSPPPHPVPIRSREGSVGRCTQSQVQRSSPRPPQRTAHREGAGRWAPGPGVCAEAPRDASGRRQEGPGPRADTHVTCGAAGAQCACTGTALSPGEPSPGDAGRRGGTQGACSSLDQQGL